MEDEGKAEKVKRNEVARMNDNQGSFQTLFQSNQRLNCRTLDLLWLCIESRRRTPESTTCKRGCTRLRQGFVYSVQSLDTGQQNLDIHI